MKRGYMNQYKTVSNIENKKLYIYLEIETLNRLPDFKDLICGNWHFSKNFMGLDETSH